MQEEQAETRMVEVETDGVMTQRRTKQKRQRGRESRIDESRERVFRRIQIFVKTDNSRTVTMDGELTDKVGDVMRRVACDSERDVYVIL